MKKILLTIIMMFALVGDGWGAFPTTPILDTFNRADEGPPPSSDWTNTLNGMKVASNVAIGDSSSDFNFSKWNATPSSADVEVYATITAKNPGESFWLELRFDGGTGNGYALAVDPKSGTDSIRIQRYTGFSWDALETYNQEFSVGDSFGFSAVGDILTAHYKTTAGSWTVLGTHDISGDSPKYTAAGDIFLGSYKNVTSVDDFGGGSHVAGRTRRSF